MDNIVGRLQSLFPSHQFDVIIGSLLGDARLECRSVGARCPITARFRVHHGEKQKEYVFWKYEILKDLVSKEPKEITWDNPKRGLHEVSWYFHTKSFREFGLLNQYFYQHEKKILPDYIFDLITPKMLAIWFMDDGSYTGNSATISTHSFAQEDQVRAAGFLRTKFGINATIVKDRTKWKISIGKYDFENFISVIQPFIIPSMIYKIGSPRNDLSAIGGRSDSLLRVANTSVPS
jgi:hypothetical protein